MKSLDPRDRARKLLDNPPRRCGDHSCCFGGPKGMGTNGGCRCGDSRLEVQMMRNHIAQLRAVLNELLTDTPERTC